MFISMQNVETIINLNLSTINLSRYKNKFKKFMSLS